MRELVVGLALAVALVVLGVACIPASRELEESCAAEGVTCNAILPVVPALAFITAPFLALGGAFATWGRV